MNDSLLKVIAHHNALLKQMQTEHFSDNSMLIFTLVGVLIALATFFINAQAHKWRSREIETSEAEARRRQMIEIAESKVTALRYEIRNELDHIRVTANAANDSAQRAVGEQKIIDEKVNETAARLGQIEILLQTMSESMNEIKLAVKEITAPKPKTKR